jgi:hypothetical protein
MHCPSPTALWKVLSGSQVSGLTAVNPLRISALAGRQTAAFNFP